MRAAGLFLPSEEQVLDELFGHNGILESWADSDVLRERFVGLWEELRPIAEEVEQEARDRGLRLQESRRRTAGREVAAEAAMVEAQIAAGNPWLRPRPSVNDSATASTRPPEGAWISPGSGATRPGSAA